MTASTYAVLQKVLDVIPADIPGMDFVTGGFISGYQVLLFSLVSILDQVSCARKVFFDLQETKLVIRTRQESKVLELVPHHELAGDLPTSFVDNYTHWIDPSNGEIELRPREKLWESSI